MRYAFVSLGNTVKPETYRDVLVAALVLADETTKEENVVRDPAKVEIIEHGWDSWKGKLFPGGQSTVWAMRFSSKGFREPQIIKCFFKVNPYVLINHVASVEKFRQDFPGPIPAKGKEYFVKPVKNIALARIEGEDRFLFHVQQFSKNPVIPPSVAIGEICKVISGKGYVVDAFPKNWHLKEQRPPKPPILEYIDELFWNNIYQHQDRIQDLTAQLDDFRYPL